MNFDIEGEMERVARVAVIPAMDETLDDAVEVAARVARKKTGRMGRGWRKVRPRFISRFIIRGSFENPVPYTKFQDRGTSTGITPNNMTGQAIDAAFPRFPGRIKVRLQ